MIGDLLVDWDYQLDERGKIVEDDNGDPILIEKCQVFPIHKDDELILFQMPGKSSGGNQGQEYGGATELQCLCCYGHAEYNPRRTTTVRQKYKYIGCSWTWYPPKYAFNYDQNIPQCGIAAGINPDQQQLDYKFNCFDYTSLGLNAEYAKSACPLCTQINPFLINSNITDSNGRDIFDIWGNLNPGVDSSVRDTDQSISPMGSGWFTQYMATLYPGHVEQVGLDCCTCKVLDLTNDNTVPPDINTSCWRITQNQQISGTDCSNIDDVKNKQYILSANGGYFYSTFENRTNDRKLAAEILSNQVFIVGNDGTNTPLYLVNSDLSSVLYTPSKGGYSQNNCTFCSLSPYLRELAHNQYPWAFDIFCAGGGLSTSAKTFNFPVSFIKTGFFTNLSSPNDWYLETISQGMSEAEVPLEDYKEVLGEHTFYSQFVGMVQLEHYWHYTGVHKDDIDAARNTLPPSIDPTDDPKERWDYWKQRTTPKMFTLKSSATPLFTFDLVYADRVGILQKFTDPDITATDETGGRARMTVAKFLSYFSQFSNGYRFSGRYPLDDRGRAIFPTGCETPGYQFVRIIKEILDAMCEANIIGTRDHRPVIYNEIKQIIETGIANGRNGAYYKPWAQGNPIFVTPSDFDKLKSKYYDAYGEKMCTETEMFPVQGLNGLGRFAPIRKIIPPSLIALPNVDWNRPEWNSNIGFVPEQPPILYRANTVDPDKIFNEEKKFTRLCTTGVREPVTVNPLYPEKKIQDLQFSKYYSGGSYNPNSPDYVNSQLFFRAIPGRWGFVKWANLVNYGDWCNRINPCSPYEIYGIGASVTGSPDYLWHSEDVRTTLYTEGDSRYAGGFVGMCNGVNPDQAGGPNEDETLCRNSNARLNSSAALYCSYTSIAWDASGNPTKAYCTPVCPQQTTECTSFPCGARCGGYQACADANIRVNGNTDWDETKTCAQLFGSSCCECIGKDPDVNLTVRDWIAELIDNRKCETCADQCNFACPVDNGPPSFTSINGEGGIGGGANFSNSQSNIPFGDDRFYKFGVDTGNPGGGGGAGGGGAGGGGGGGGGGVGCDCANLECVQIARAACDLNCGYNGFSYTPLACVLSQSNYGWDKKATYPDPDNGTVTVCSICSCRSSNYCYVRFAGKVQSYLPNSQTGFYEPTEDPDGKLFETSFINLEVPAHYVSPQSKAGETATTLLSCGTDCTSQGSNDVVDCTCRNNSLATMMCPGAVVKQNITRRYQDGQCNAGALWCGFYRSGRIILNGIKSSDIIDSNYEY